MIPRGYDLVRTYLFPCSTITEPVSFDSRRDARFSRDYAHSLPSDTPHSIPTDTHPPDCPPLTCPWLTELADFTAKA
jgi:hypothetical protein